MTQINSGDTAWILVSTALVMLMTPGLALFYGGMVRKKNILSMLSLCFITIALVSVQWVTLGYSLSFGTDIGGLIGGMTWAFFNNMGLDANPAYAPNIPHIIFALFQMMFAIITAAIISSAFAERVKFKSYIIFTVIWVTLVYCPIAHWVWGGGFIDEFGALDFAGGTVVHISSGISALAIALIIGKRTGYKEYAFEPHSLPLTTIGTALLWFGWFGFNAGSSLAADGLAANAFLVTNTSAATAALTWMFLGWHKNGNPSMLGLLSGAVTGLVVITPAAGYVDPLSAMAIGAIGSVICYYAVLYRSRSEIDESLDAFAIHGVGGIVGALMTGVFASSKVNPAISGGLISGNLSQLTAQLITVAIVIAYSFLATVAIGKAIDLVFGLKVNEQEEYIGLDLSEHREKAYS